MHQTSECFRMDYPVPIPFENPSVYCTVLPGAPYPGFLPPSLHRQKELQILFCSKSSLIIMDFLPPFPFIITISNPLVKRFRPAFALFPQCFSKALQKATTHFGYRSRRSAQLQKGSLHLSAKPPPERKDSPQWLPSVLFYLFPLMNHKITFGSFPSCAPPLSAPPALCA